MSKLDAQRAMREARWAASQKQPSATSPTRTPARRTAIPTKGGTAQTEAPASEAAAGACGHRSMNGRTCSRPSGHSEKSHRYS